MEEVQHRQRAIKWLVGLLEQHCHTGDLNMVSVAYRLNLGHCQ